MNNNKKVSEYRRRIGVIKILDCPVNELQLKYLVYYNNDDVQQHKQPGGNKRLLLLLKKKNNNIPYNNK